MKEFYCEKCDEDFDYEEAVPGTPSPLMVCPDCGEVLVQNEVVLLDDDLEEDTTLWGLLLARAPETAAWLNRPS